MDDSINSGSDNKLPLFIGIGAIAVALLALLFAFKARGDAKVATEKLAAIESTVEAAKSDITVVKNSAAKTADIQAVSTEFETFKGNTTATLVQFQDAINAQNKVITGMVSHGGTAKPNGKTDAKTGATAAPTAGAGEYAVKKGDTGTKIAKASGVSIKALTEANPGVDFTKLKVGQIIKVPAKK